MAPRNEVIFLPFWRVFDRTAQERPVLIMLIRRNAVEVWHVARIEKRGGDLFLEKIDTLPVTGSLVKGEGPGNGYLRPGRDFLGICYVF